MSNRRRMSRRMRQRRARRRRMIACIAAVAIIALGAVGIILTRHNGVNNADQEKQSVETIAEIERATESEPIEAANEDIIIVYFDFSENIGDTSG